MGSPLMACISIAIASSRGKMELAPFLLSTPGSALVAHEAVIRGADLNDDPVALVLPSVLDLPLVLQAWEP